MRPSNMAPLVVILMCCLCTNVVLSKGKRHKHEEPGYWDSFLKSLGPTATAILQNPEVKAVLDMINSLHDKFETKDIEDRFEEFSRMDFGALSSLNIGLEDIGVLLNRGMNLLSENPVIIHMLSQYLKENGILPQRSNAVEEAFKVLNNLYNSDQVAKVMVEMKKSLESLPPPDPSKAGRFHFASMRALGDTAIRLTGLRSEYRALEAYTSFITVIESLLDYLRFVYESVSEAQAQNQSVTIDGKDHKISLIVAIVRDILQAPQAKLHIALRDADNVAADLQALEFVADKFKPANNRQSFAQLTEELDEMANEIRESRQAALAMDDAYMKLDAGLIERALELKPHLDKLSRDLKIGARTLSTLQPAENLSIPKRRNVAQLIPVVRELSGEVAQAVIKFSQLYEVAKKIEHVTDAESMMLFLTKLRALLVDTPKFENLIDATDQFYYNIGHIVESSRTLSDEL